MERKPIWGTLANRLLPKTSGAQTCWGPLGECVEQSSAELFDQRGKGTGLWIHQPLTIIGWRLLPVTFLTFLFSSSNFSLRGLAQSSHQSDPAGRFTGAYGRKCGPVGDWGVQRTLQGLLWSCPVLRVLAGCLWSQDWGREADEHALTLPWGRMFGDR